MDEPACYRECERTHNEHACKIRIPPGDLWSYRCTLPAFHPGEHVACGYNETNRTWKHALAVWTDRQPGEEG